MCLGPEIAMLAASAALAAGGTAYNAHQTNKQQNKASLAASNAQMSNLARQKAQGEKSKQLLQRPMQDQARPQQDVRLNDATAAREAQINSNVSQVRDYSPTPSSAPQVVRGAQDRKAESGQAKLAAENAALAKLGGWGDTQRQNQVDLGRTGGQIGENNSFVQGIANLLPGEQNQAVGKVTNKPLNPMGDLAIAGGNVGVSAFYPQAALPTWADVLGMPAPKRRGPMGRANPNQVS